MLAQGSVPPSALGRKYLNSFSPYGGWYVLGVPAPFSVGGLTGTDHATPYTYDTHVPLVFYGFPFQPGVYRTAAQPIDLVATFASLLGINAPAAATGRVLVEALSPLVDHRARRLLSRHHQNPSLLLRTPLPYQLEVRTNEPERRCYRRV